MINLQDGNGRNALAFAISPNPNKTDEISLAILTRLLEVGGDPNSLWNPKSKSRLLHYAAQKGNTDLLKLLIEKGAELNSKTKGDTALALAAKNRHIDVVMELIKHGVDVENERTINLISNHIASLAKDKKTKDILKLLGQNPILYTFPIIQAQLKSFNDPTFTEYLPIFNYCIELFCKLGPSLDPNTVTLYDSDMPMSMEEGWQYFKASHERSSKGDLGLSDINALLQKLPESVKNIDLGIVFSVEMVEGWGRLESLLLSKECNEKRLTEALNQKGVRDADQKTLLSLRRAVINCQAERIKGESLDYTIGRFKERIMRNIYENKWKREKKKPGLKPKGQRGARAKVDKARREGRELVSKMRWLKQKLISLVLYLVCLVMIVIQTAK